MGKVVLDTSIIVKVKDEKEKMEFNVVSSIGRLFRLITALALGLAPASSTCLGPLIFFRYSRVFDSMYSFGFRSLSLENLDNIFNHHMSLNLTPEYLMAEGL